MNVLPCVNCGNPLSGLVEGTVVQCFACGTDNVLLESIDTLSRFTQEFFSWNRLPELPESDLKPLEIQDRQKLVEELFQDFLQLRQGVNQLVVTRVDEVQPELEETRDMAMKFGNLAVFLVNFIFPIVKGTGREQMAREMYFQAILENLTLTGLAHSIQSRKSYELEDAAKFLEKSERNFERAVERCEEAKSPPWALDFSSEKILFHVAAKFSSILQQGLNDNPAYHSQELEDLVVELNALEITRARILKSQIQHIYMLSTSIQFFLEELRNRDLFGEVEVYQEHSLDHVEDKLGKIREIMDWMDQIREKFKHNQKELMKLHLGRFVAYLKTYRQEFESRFASTIEFFDDLLEKVIKNGISDHGLECIELFDEIEELLGFEAIEDETIINRLAAYHDDLEELDESLKRLTFELFKIAKERNLQKAFLSEVVRTISEKHSDFDLKLLDFINTLFKHFQDERNEEKMNIDQQREYFLSTLQPRVKKLIDASFTLKEENIPYPIFMELVLASRELKVQEARRVSIIIENPSLVDVKGVSITFFVPNSFDIMQRSTSFSRVKPGDKKTVTTEIIPTERGPYHLMGMVQYEHVNESFWLPSVKLEVFVKGEGDQDVDIEALLARREARDQELDESGNQVTNVDTPKVDSQTPTEPDAPPKTTGSPIPVVDFSDMGKKVSKQAEDQELDDTESSHDE